MQPKPFKRLGSSVLVAVALMAGVAAAPGNGVFLVRFPAPADDQIGSFELLGGSSGGKWLLDDGLKVSPAKYDLWGLSSKLGAVQGANKVSFGDPCNDTYSVEVSPKPTAQRWLMAVNAPWNPRPRAVTIIPNANSTYQAVLRDFLRQKGLSQPTLQLDTVVRTDLDNDGSDEVILTATHFAAEPSGFPPVSSQSPPVRGQKGDYSLMLVRKLVKGKLQTIDLGSDVFVKPTTDADIEAGTQNNPDAFALVNVLDLNGDGKMEIIMLNAIYEDYGVSVMEWDGKAFRQRLVTGCGA